MDEEAVEYDLATAMAAVDGAMAAVRPAVVERVLKDSEEDITDDQEEACNTHMELLFNLEDLEVTDQRFVKAVAQMGKYWIPEMDTADYRMMGTQNIWSYRKMFIRSFRENNLKMRTLWEIFAVGCHMRNKSRVQMWFEGNRRNLKPSMELRAAFDWIIRRTSSSPKEQDTNLPAYVKLSPSFPELSAYAYVRVALEMGMSVGTVVRDLVKEVWLASLALRGSARDANRKSYTVFWNTVVDRKMDGQEITPRERIAKMDWYDRSAQDAVKLISPDGTYFLPESSYANQVFVGYEMKEVTDWVMIVLNSVEGVTKEEVPVFIPHEQILVT